MKNTDRRSRYKRIVFGLSFALASVFTLSLVADYLPWDVFSESVSAKDEYVSDESQLNNAISEGYNVVLEQDITMENQLVIDDGKKHIINLNGYSLEKSPEAKRNFPADGSIIVVDKESTLELGNKAGSNGGIRGGNSDKGSAVKVIDGILKAKEVNFTGNDAKEGGAIYASEKATVNIEGCNFERDRAENGGAIYNKGAMVIKNSNILQNNASKKAGGIYNGGYLVIDGCKVDGNISHENGGGIYVDTDGFTEIKNESKLVYNRAGDSTNKSAGGAIACNKGDLTVKNTKISNNIASYAGGGIWSAGSDVELKDVEALNNEISDNNGYGGFGYFEKKVSIEECTIRYNTAAYGGGIYIKNTDASKLVIKGGKVVINSNIQIRNKSANNDIEFEKYKKIRIKGTFDKGSSIGIVPPDSETDLTEGYDEYNEKAPEKVFVCNSEKYIIKPGNNYPEARTKKPLKATNTGYKTSVAIHVTDDADCWDYCYVEIYGRKNNGKGKEKLVWSSPDVKEAVDEGDERYNTGNVDCKEYFPSRVVIKTSFGFDSWFSRPDWEAEVDIRVNGAHCKSYYIVIEGKGILVRNTNIDVGGSKAPYPCLFDIEAPNEIEKDDEDGGVVKVKALDQYGVEWKNSSDSYSIENVSFPNHDKVNTIDKNKLDFKLTSDLAENHQSTYRIKFNTANDSKKTITKDFTVRFVFPLKVEVIVDDEVVMTKKGTQGDTFDIKNLKTPKGYTVYNIDKTSDSSSIVYDETTGKYTYIFGNEDDKLEVELSSISYVVEFNANADDVSTKMRSKTYFYDRKYKLTKCSYRRADYVFNGWNTEKDGSGTSYDDKAEISNLADEEGARIILYAQWESTNTGSIFSDGNGILITGILFFGICGIWFLGTLSVKRRKA